MNDKILGCKTHPTNLVLDNLGVAQNLIRSITHVYHFRVICHDLTHLKRCNEQMYVCHIVANLSNNNQNLNHPSKSISICSNAPITVTDLKHEFDASKYSIQGKKIWKRTALSDLNLYDSGFILFEFRLIG